MKNRGLPLLPGLETKICAGKHPAKIAVLTKPTRPDWSEHEAAGKVKRKAGANSNNYTGLALLILIIIL